MNHWPFPYKTLDGLNNFGGGGGTVTSISVTVPSWLSVAVTNPTTTPLIAITGSATGTGITVLQDSPTINTLLTVSGQLDIPRNSGSGHAVKITNAHAGVQDNYIEVGKNSSNRNHAHFGHHFEASGDAGNYAFIQTNNHFIKFAGTADFTFPATASANNGNLLFSTTTGVTSWSNTFNNGVTGYIFNSPVDFNAQVLINTNLILNSTLQVNGDLMVNQNTANGRLAYFYNDSVNENVGNQIYVGRSYSDSVQLGHYYATNLADRYAYLQTNNTKMIFTGEAAWKFPTTLGTSGQSLITNGAGVTSWANRVSAVSATVPSFMSVTVTNPNTTPAIAISAPSTGSGNVVLATSPTMSTPIIENFGTVSALIGQNAAATIVVRALTDVYITKYKPGAVGTLDNAFMITANPSSNSDTYFYAKGTNVGIFTQAPQESLDVQGSIRASNFIRFNNVSVYPGSSGVTSLYLPTSPGTNGQVLTSTGSGTAMTWTTPATGTVTSVAATSPLASSGGATPTISLSTVPTTLGGTGLTTVGTNGQVLTSNGTSLNWTTPATGTVTSVAATSPLASSGGATPTISIASSTGTGSVVLNNGPTFDTQFNLDSPGTNDGYVRFVSVGNANYIQSALQPVAGSTADFKFTDYNAANTWMTIAAGGNVGIGTTSPGTKFVVEGAPASFGIQYLSSTATLSTTINTVDILHRWYESTGNASYIDLSWIRTSAGGTWQSAGQRFQAKTDTSFQGYVQFNGDNDHGLSFGTGISTTAHGVAERMRIDGSGNVGILGNVGIGTISPAYTLDVNRSGVGIPQLAVREGFFGGFRTQWNYSAGQGETTFFDYRGSGAGGFWFKNLDTSNADVGWASISGGLGYFNGDGENLILDGATHSYLRWRVGNVNYGFFGYTSGGTQTIALYNQRPTGDLAFDMANTNGLIRFYKPIVIENVVTVKKAPSSSVFDFILPSDPGTAGQYLISGGAGAAMYWGSGGGGGGGSVNSVTASAPLASSGGTAPNISIASATGTGSVVLSTGPSMTTFMNINATPAGQGLLQFISVANANYIQSGLNGSSGSSADLYFGTISDTAKWMTIKNTGNVGIGTTAPTAKLHVNGSLRVQGAAITQNGGENQFSNGSFFDPDSGQAYNAKFGNTDPLSNGIAVKGNSRFTGVVVALGGFTNNITDIFTYATYTVPTSDIVMLGSNLNVGTYGIDCVGAALGNISYVDRFMFMCKAGNTITITFGINFGYVNNPTPGFNSMVLLCNNSGAFPIRKTSSTYSLYAQGACNYPSSITGVTNPLTMTAENITYAGGAYVGLSVTGQTGVVGYNPTFGQAGQKLYGSVTYIII